MVVVGGGGTRYDCLGGESPSDRSTLTYVLRASPRVDSGSHASRREEDIRDCEVEEEDEGREFGVGFCCNSAMYPGILSFEDGVGWM